MEYGHIEITTEMRQVAPDTWQRFITDAQWEGPAIARVSLLEFQHTRVNVGDVLTLGPLRLRVVGHDNYRPRMALLVTRDTRFAWFWRWRCAIAQKAAPIKPRIIMTLAIWGLARWQTHTQPVWRDVHLIRWLFFKHTP